MKLFFVILIIILILIMIYYLILNYKNMEGYKATGLYSNFKRKKYSSYKDFWYRFDDPYYPYIYYYDLI